MFSWIAIYQELGAHLLDFRDRQDELIATLQEISLPPHNVPMISLRDKADDGSEIELTEIDPFTFFAAFNRGLTDKNRLAILHFLREKFALQAPLPTDFDGIPVVDNTSSWFFPHRGGGRQDDDVTKLWDLAATVVQNTPQQLDAALFERCLAIRWVGMAKLTMGMFWLNPTDYLATDKRIASYAAARGIAMPTKTLASYQDFIAQMHAQVGANHAQISRDAWLQAINPQKIAPSPTSATNYWKISPGEKAILWDDWQQNHLIAIGWPLMGDVRNLSASEMEAKRLEVTQHPETHRYTPESVKQLWRFAHDIKPGDRVIANKGTTQVLGVGIVTGECEFDSQAEHYLHRIPVKWTNVTPKAVQKGGWRSTLIQLTRTEFETLTQGEADSEVDSTIAIKPNSYPLNQILYGPPGTGKTYNAIERAVEIIDSQKPTDHATAKQRFDQLRREGRIGFVTFHQSFGYEDFIEGIRPLIGDGARQGHYEIRDGILKEFALRAIAAALQSVTVAPHDGPTFEQLWEELAQRIEDDAPYEIDGLKTSRYRLALSPRGNLTGDNVQGNAQQPYNSSRTNIEKVWRQLPGEQIPTHDKMRAILGKGSHTNFIGAVVVELRRLQKQWQPKLTTKEDRNRALTTEDARAFLSGSPDFTLQVLAPRFVLIIDEINRGNIAKILGELITLLEADKRLGADNALTVTLPFSDEEFALPLNLSLLGTMNTADKSLALLDVALRRRFKFQEYAPDFSRCENLPPRAAQVLAALNHRIVLGKDRDHRIGHAFFITVKTAEQWNEVFRSEIIPLLQEYFYSDWDGLRFALGEEGANGRLVRSLSGSQRRGVRNRWQWFFDAGIELDCLQALHENYFSNTESTGENNGEL